LIIANSCYSETLSFYLLVAGTNQSRQIQKGIKLTIHQNCSFRIIFKLFYLIYTHTHKLKKSLSMSPDCEESQSTALSETSIAIVQNQESALFI